MTPYLVVFGNMDVLAIQSLQICKIPIRVLPKILSRTANEELILKTNIKLFHEGCSNDIIQDVLAVLKSAGLIEAHHEVPTTKMVRTISETTVSLIEKDASMSILLTKYRSRLNDESYYFEMTSTDRCDVYVHKVVERKIEYEQVYGDRTILTLKS